MLPTRVRSSVHHVPMVLGLCCCMAISCDMTGSTVEPPPPASLAQLFGHSLVMADGTPVGVDALEGKAIIAIYFAAKGCPACATFTPMLVDVYDELRQAGRSFEVVLVSSDGSEASMYAYMLDAGMAWPAMPWGTSKCAALRERYGVRWIPTLVIIDGAGNTVSLNGHEEIGRSGAAAYGDWLARSGQS